eukprot:SM000123S25844  [mRNA]  locus=s123:269328:270478:+ [translate_table: standard]
MDGLPDDVLAAVLARAAARPDAPPAWAAIVRVCRRVFVPLEDVTGFTALESLSLTCSDATDGDIQAITVACQRISELELHGSYRYTDVSLKAIAKDSRQLRRFCASDCYNITESGLELLATGCSLLEDIGVANCPSVAVGAAHTILSHCHELRTLQTQRSWGDRWLQPPNRGSLNLSPLNVVDLCIPDGTNDIITAMATLASLRTDLHELRARAEHNPDELDRLVL